MRRCAFCEIVFEPRPTGRRPTFCSKPCRQADYRERHGLVARSPWHDRRRRRELRATAELVRLRERDPDARRRDLIHDAREAAWAAWPRLENGAVSSP